MTTGEVLYTEVREETKGLKAGPKTRGARGRLSLSLTTSPLLLACAGVATIAACFALFSSTSLLRRKNALERAATEDALINSLSSAPSNWTKTIEFSSRYTYFSGIPFADDTFSDENAVQCTAYRLPRHRQTLHSLEPRIKGDMDALHHMLLYSCETLPEAKLLNSDDVGAPPVWDCDYRKRKIGLPCGKGRGYNIWSWGKEYHGARTPGMSFGSDHGFSLEHRTKDLYIVLENHFQPSSTGAEVVGGIDMAFDTEPPHMYLGLLGPLGAGRALDIPGGREFAEFNTQKYCLSGTDPQELFAHRVHQHQFGTRVSLVAGDEEVFDGYTNAPHGQDWVEPEPMSVMIPPQTPFYTHCEFNTTEATVDHVKWGSSHNSDMCTTYLMTASEQRMKWFRTQEGMRVTNYPMHFAQRISSRFKALKAGSMGEVGPAHLGNVGGMQMGFGKEKPFIYIFHRADRRMRESDNLHPNPINDDTVVVWDLEKRTQVRSFGSGLAYMPNGMTVDLKGNLWITDVDSQMVHKLDPYGRVLMKVGTEGQTGSGEYTFCGPTDVAVASDGRFFVADGYCNSRVVEFSAEGKYIREHPIPGGNVIHNVLYDGCKDQLWITDRQNSKVLVYSLGRREIPNGDTPLPSEESVWETVKRVVKQTISRVPPEVKDPSVTKVIDLSKWGFVYGIAMDEYGNIHALTWRRKDKWPQDGRAFVVPMLDSGTLKGAPLDDLGPFWPQTLSVTYDYAKSKLVAYVGQAGPTPQGRVSQYNITL